LKFGIGEIKIILEKDELENALITAFRQLVQSRYQYDKLETQYELPSVITPDRVEEVRGYFLDHVYPDYETRQKLNEAFDSLDGHIKNPGHLVRLLMDSAGLVFKYGRSLPKIMRTGIKALQSFRKASGFEKMLHNEAVEREMPLPIDQEELKTLIASLPQKKVNDFIEDNDALFDALMDRKLMEKTGKIMQELIKRMKKKPDLYMEADIEGVQIGLNILDGGVNIVKGISQHEGEEVLEFIKQVERDSMDEIFATYRDDENV